MGVSGVYPGVPGWDRRLSAPNFHESRHEIHAASNGIDLSLYENYSRRFIVGALLIPSSVCGTIELHFDRVAVFGEEFIGSYRPSFHALASEVEHFGSHYVSDFGSRHA